MKLFSAYGLLLVLSVAWSVMAAPLSQRDGDQGAVRDVSLERKPNLLSNMSRFIAGREEVVVTLREGVVVEMLEVVEGEILEVVAVEEMLEEVEEVEISEVIAEEMFEEMVEQEQRSGGGRWGMKRGACRSNGPI
ncbi:hypothetical protein FRC19_010362 [Serendipita sp. 401]|nr:hypothetical protein FRC19_010362 [Serendipita sp. 401]